MANNKVSYDLGSGFIKIASRVPINVPEKELAVIGEQKMLLEDGLDSKPVYRAAVPNVGLELRNSNLISMYGGKVFFGTQAADIIDQIKVDGQIRPEDGIGGHVIRAGRVADPYLFKLVFEQMVGYVQSKEQDAAFELPPQEFADVYEATQQKIPLLGSAKTIVDLIQGNPALKRKRSFSQASGAAASEGFGIERMEHSIVLAIGEGTTDGVAVHMSDPAYTPRSHVRTLRLESANGTRFYACAELMKDLLEALNGQKYDSTVSFDLNNAREILVKFGIVDPTADKKTVDALKSYTLLDESLKEIKVDISQPVLTTCARIVPYLATMVRELGQVSKNKDHRRQMVGNIRLAGGGSNIRGLDKAVESALQKEGVPAKVERVKSPVWSTADGGLRIIEKVDQKPAA